MTYTEALRFLESFVNYEKIPSYPYKQSLKLERIRDFLKEIGSPQEGLRYVHVAGSKGKGSTCAFIANILKEAGYRAGLYTSPHLSDFRERIRILAPSSKLQAPSSDFEGMISKKALAGLVTELKPSIQRYNKNSQYGPLTFFELYTALALMYFRKKKVDFAVLETGLGGRLDATNVVNSGVCAISPISYEHTQKLGRTLKEIAFEKAGIIKRQKAKGKRQNLTVISAPQPREAERVIINRCRKTGTSLFIAGKDLRYAGRNDNFKVKTGKQEYKGLKIRLLGAHQLVNAAVSVGVIDALRASNPDIGVECVKRGLYRTIWPGRCEVVSNNPLVVLDGAQNTASALALKETIKRQFKYRNLILVLGISNDKDLKGICSQLRSLADTVILTKADNPRATEPEILARYFRGLRTCITTDTPTAKEVAYQIAGIRDLILVTGSLFVIGEFRK